MAGLKILEVFFLYSVAEARTGQIVSFLEFLMSQLCGGVLLRGIFKQRPSDPRVATSRSRAEDQVVSMARYALAFALITGVCGVLIVLALIPSGRR
jgi:archaellum biogenesis protein FlaJ (TadC family)